jgi:Protein of unknown function (DUF3306)
MTGSEDHDEKFLQRWSRLKRATEAPPRDDSEPSPRQPSDPDPDALLQGGVQNAADLPLFDPATLPPIESIGAASDIRAFLAPEVPESLKRAALRRAWVTDPAIRDFVGVAEAQWDFNKPDSIPGFGALELTPELCRMVAGLFSDPPVETTPPRLADIDPREQVEVHDISAEPPSAAIALAPPECASEAERSQVEEVQADAVELASTGRPKDEALQPIHSKRKTSTPK